MNFVSECRHYDNENKLCRQNFRQSIIKQRIVRRIYSLPKPSRRFWNACAQMPIPSILVNANEL